MSVDKKALPKVRKSWLAPIGGAAGQRLLVCWEAPIGAEVFVTRDDGLEQPTVTRSAPWMLHTIPVILLEGISGGYALSRVRLRTERRRVHLAKLPPADRAKAGCSRTLTRGDVLAGDLELVNCAKCLREVELFKQAIDSAEALGWPMAPSSAETGAPST